MVEAESGLNDLEGQNLRYSMEKVKADASGIILCVRQLKGLLNHFGMVEANIEKRSQELELKEKELQALSSDLEKKSKTFEAEKSVAGDLKKLAEECTQELRSKRNQLTAKLDYLSRIQRELESKNKQLEHVINEVRKVEERKSEMEDETDRKKKELSQVVNQIEESGKQHEKRSREVELKEKHIEEKGKELDLVKSQVKSWERKLIQLRKLAGDDCTTELNPSKDQVESSNNSHREVELKKKQLGQTKSIKHPPLLCTYERKKKLKHSEETEEKHTHKGGITN